MQIPVGKTNVPLAIVGMACRLPGADNLEQYWQLLRDGGSAVAELPGELLDQALYYDPRKGQRGKTYCKLGALITSRQFNRQACPIPNALESAVDNAHLLMCEVAATACRHAGLDPFNLALRNTGVFIGHAQGSDLAGELTYGTCVEEAAQFLREVTGFRQLPAEQQELTIRGLVDTIRAQMPERRPDTPDVAINMVAGTISKAFGLNGPFLAINSACASSLQAIQLAARALQLGRIEMAIVGGASDCKAGSLVLFAHAQSMSDTGSRPFDAGADGLICSEGYVALVLKTLARALADGDPIQAIIPGLGASSDGRGKSLWAPRKEGQVKAMERAYRNGLEMGTLQYIEAHATSTSLGDATELNALTEILSGKFPPGKQIPISSVKANIGHTLEAAGISGVIKTVLCMQHRTFVPAINIESLNPKINWESAPFYIPRELTAWPEQPDGSPRRAAVNAFGIGGLNMHLVLEEFTEARRDALKSLHPMSRPVPRAADDAGAIAVVGMSCILPGAANLKKYWELIASGRDPKGPPPEGRWRTDLAYEPLTRKPYRASNTLGGYITDFAYDWQKYKVPPKQVQQADPLQFMLLEAAEQALIDAGYDQRDFDRTRVAVFVGTESGGDFGTQLGLSLRLPHLEMVLKQLLAQRGVAAENSSQIASDFSEVLLGHWPALIDESGSFSTSTLASRITKTMNLMGGAAAIDASDASSAAALASSMDLLLSGDCDMMICAGGQRCMSLPQYEGLTQTGVLSGSENPRSAFDAAATGIVPGEGVGVVLLKRLSDARRDGDRIHAIIRGIGAAHAESIAESMTLAMNRAFETAGVSPADVALIEVDGTGFPERDQQQLQAIAAVYGRAPRSEPLLLGSITGQIGHTMGASGMAHFLKASLEVEGGQMPRTFGLEEPLAFAAQNATVLRPATASSPIRHATRDGRRLAAVSSFSKGQAYHILLERGEKVAVPEIDPTPAAKAKPLAATPAPAKTVAPSLAASSTSQAKSLRVLRLGAATPAELGNKLQQALTGIPAAFAAAEHSAFSPDNRVRLAIVAGSADKLGEKLQITAKQWTNPAASPVLEQQGCFYRALAARRPRIAFLFPGQGSQYPGMLRELVRDVPAAAATLREFDSLMAGRGFQTFAQMAWETPNQLGADIWTTQIAMLLANVIMHSAVTDLGIVPDLISSHSYGEFAALTAAAVWDFEGAITAARARYDGIEATPTARGTMLATTASPQVIELVAAMLKDRAYIANYNAADQTIVGGRAESLRELSALLEARGHKSQLISVPCPFHTPLMQGAAVQLGRALESLPLDPPCVPLLSSVTNRYVAEPVEIRGNLVAQLTTPVRYLDLVNRIAADRETVFVEVGPQQALTRLNRRILEGRSVPGMIACDNPKHPGIEQLLCVRALLECLGAIASPGVVERATRLSKIVIPHQASATPQRLAKGDVLHVDATERRREKMRRSAMQGDGTAEGGNGAPPTTAIDTPSGKNGVAPHGQTSQVAVTVQRAAPVSLQNVPQVVPVEQPSTFVQASIVKAASSKPAADNPPNPPSAELEKFLINFVVEQTGYPPEVVELDADLEADLGIDSIKKAQLFGELAEYFDVQPNENMTLDDFPTLRHVLNFLSDSPTKVDLGPAALDARTPRSAVAAPQVEAPVATPAKPVVGTAATAAGPDEAELEKFLINFVVEQTGYPPEVVELDADLEADLGIDSIKKAQLFGELAEYFDVQPNENMTLDDFPTLRHVLSFLSGAPTKVDLATPQSFAPADQVAAAPPLEPAVASAPASSSHDSAELEKFLINFVVEQTGYPPEVVELDADLEADLGIDSIKKAQLFGELAEYFDVQPTENLTLDDFPTLRHVLNFLLGAELKKNFIPNASDPLDQPLAVEDPVLEMATWRSGGPESAVATSTAATLERVQTARDELPVMRLAGTPYQMGCERGRQSKTLIRRMLRRFADLAETELTDLPIAGAVAGDTQRHFTADELDELQGIADAARVPLSNLLALNLAIDADFGSRATHLAVTSARSAGQLIHATSQQLPLMAALSDLLQTVVEVRSPSHGHPHILISFAGLVGGLSGVNAHGLAVTAGMRVGDSSSNRHGRTHAVIPPRLLAEAHDVESALRLLERYADGQAWNACLSHGPTDRLAYVECDGQRLDIQSGQATIVAGNRVSSELKALFSSQSESKFTADQIALVTSPDTGEVEGSSVSVAFDTKSGDIWIRSGAQANAACRFSIGELLPRVADPPLLPATPTKYDLDDPQNAKTHRFVMRTVAAPFHGPVDDMPRWNGAALIVGSNPAAEALRRRLQAAGVVVRELPIVDELDATLAAFERLWNEQPLPHLFIMTARDEDLGDPADEAAWNRRRYRVAVMPYFLCQRWIQLAGDGKMLDRSTLIAATSLNGDFGFSGNVADPESAALAGLTKAIYIEFVYMRNSKNMIVKTIDSPQDEPPDVLAANICREIASKAIDFEVAYVAGRRWLQYAEPQKAPVRIEAEIRRGGTWVFTGGARGITAECALELGKRFDLKLHLIGTSDLPRLDPAWRNLSDENLKELKTKVMREARSAGASMDDAWSRVQKDIEIDRALHAFSAAGVRASYHSCDVADRDALERVLRTIRKTSGPIEGIVHGAGIEKACKYERKNPAVVMATIAAKVDGAMNLIRLTREDPVRYFIGFGSISGRMGSNGQTDYCLANDLLCKLVAWHRGQRPGVRAVTFHWHPWGDVGMAARPEAAGAMRRADGPSPMPKQEGVRHFVRELHAGVPETEILITDWEFHGRYYGAKDHPQPPGDQGPPPRPVDDSVAAEPSRADSTWEPLPFKPIASRLTLTTVDAPLPPGTATIPRFDGPACILGNNLSAQALRDRLTAAGVRVHMLPVSTSPEEVTAAIEAAYSAEPPRYLFLMSGRDDDASSWLDDADWQRRRALGVVVPFLATQHWFRLRRKAKDRSGITIVAATALGGDFGLSGKVALPDGGALGGLLKSLYIEDTRQSQREVRVKIIDAPMDEPPSAVVDAILRELAANDSNIEVGWSRGKRRLVRSLAQPVETLPRQSGPGGGVWVVTGGARGITAAAARELARRFGLRLHLIGRTPAPQEDAAWRNCDDAQLAEIKSRIVHEAVTAGRSPERDWERVKFDIEIHDTLRKYAEAGVPATYHACDLSDWQRLGQILDEIRHKDGPIEGIVHGAGYGNSGRFDSRNRDRIERTIAGKLDGAVGLMSLTRQDPLRYWIGFGSISGRFGGNGLTDYAAANEMLAKLIDWQRAERPGCASCCFHWQSWDEIGMAMLGDSAVGTKGVLKMEFISPAEGVEHFCREVEAGLPAGEVLITDGFFERTFYPSTVPEQTAERQQDTLSGVELSRLPLAESVQRLQQHQAIAMEIDFNPMADPFLYEHKLRGKPLLPAVVGLEALAEGAALCGGKPAVALHQVEFIEGLRFHSDRKTAARVRAVPETDRMIHCELMSDFQNRSGDVIVKDRLNFKGSVEIADSRGPLSVSLPEPPSAWQAFSFQNDGPMYHGPTLQGVKGVSFDAEKGWGQLIALPLGALGGAHRGHEWSIPATLIDGAFYVCGIHLWVCIEQVTALPQAIDVVRLGRMPRDHEKCLSFFECREVQPRHAIYDFTVFGEDGSAIVQIEGYRCAMLKA